MGDSLYNRAADSGYGNAVTRQNGGDLAGQRPHHRDADPACLGCISDRAVLTVPCAARPKPRAPECAGSMILPSLQPHQGNPMHILLKILNSFPMFAVVLITYNLLVLSTPDINALLGQVLFSFNVVSGASVAVSTSDLLLAFGVIMLYFEIFRATRTGMASILDHTMSTLVFVIFIVEFIAVPGCGTATFLILLLMSLLDVVAGFTVTIVAARRDFGFHHGGHGGDN